MKRWVLMYLKPSYLENFKERGHIPPDARIKESDWGNRWEIKAQLTDEQYEHVKAFASSITTLVYGTGRKVRIRNGKKGENRKRQRAAGAV